MTGTGRLLPRPVANVCPLVPSGQGLSALPPGPPQQDLALTEATRAYPPDSSRDPALAEVTCTLAALRRARHSQAPLAEVRAAFSAAAEALDAALGAALASGATGRLLVRELRTARELLILQRRDIEGMDVPDCAQTTSLDADGPHTSGLEFERVDPHGPGTAHMHGLDLTTALEPATRAAAGQPGPHGTHRRPTPHPWVQEPTPRLAASSRTLPPLS